MISEIDKKIARLQELREIATFFQGNAPLLEMDYEGDVQQLGDTVQMYRSRTPLVIDRVLGSNPVAELMNLVDWQCKGCLVIALIEDKLVCGYKVK